MVMCYIIYGNVLTNPRTGPSVNDLYEDIYRLNT